MRNETFYGDGPIMAGLVATYSRAFWIVPKSSTAIPVESVADNLIHKNTHARTVPAASGEVKWLT